MRKLGLIDNDCISKKDKKKLIEFIKKSDQLSQGKKVKEFEEEFSKYIGRKYSVFVNSGSSANLLMTYSLLLQNKLRNNRVVVPAVSWSTTVSPLIQLGLYPIICDVDDSLCLDTKEFQKIIDKYDPSTLMLVHPLGFSPDMDKIVQMCVDNDIKLLEDTCESLSSSCWRDEDLTTQNLGTYGLMSSFSFFISHHITSVEGGMVCTDNEDLYHILTSIRAHGWDRDLPEEKQSELRSKHGISDFDAMYTFYYPGFNVRSTEINAVLGLEQLKRLPSIMNTRDYNYNLYRINLLNELPFNIYSKHNFVNSNFAYPIVHKNRECIVNTLKYYGVETRPLICGNIANQPFLKDKLKYPTNTPMADLIHKYGFYLPNNPSLKPTEINYICDVVIKASKGVL